MRKQRIGAGRRRGSPPGQELFMQPGAPAGSHAAELMLGPLSIRFTGMDDSWWAAFLREYAPYSRDITTAGKAHQAATLDLEVQNRSVDHFIEPPAAGAVEFMPVFVAVTPDAQVTRHWLVRACSYDVALFFSTASGKGRLLFSKQTFDSRERGVENMLRVAVAWMSLTRGGLLIHSASIARDGKAYLFFGQSGSGKSTLSESSRRGQVISDDLTLLMPDAGGRPAAVGTPFRGTYAGGPPVTGSFLVAAAFRLLKGAAHEPAAIAPMPPRVALPEAVANLPFVVDQLHLSPDLFSTVERVLTAFPIHTLRFARGNDAWWDAIEAAQI